MQLLLGTEDGIVTESPRPLATPKAPTLPDNPGRRDRAVQQAIDSSIHPVRPKSCKVESAPASCGSRSSATRSGPFLVCLALSYISAPLVRDTGCDRRLLPTMITRSAVTATSAAPPRPESWAAKCSRHLAELVTLRKRCRPPATAGVELGKGELDVVRSIRTSGLDLGG